MKQTLEELIEDYFGDVELKEVEDTIDVCMKKVDCEDVDWRKFLVYETSKELMEAILKKLAIEYLLPIAEAVKNEKGRNVIIFCNETKEKEDEVWCVRANSSELYATISFSEKTAKYLKTEK